MGQILLAKNAGYCFGVKRALKLAEEGLKRAGGRPVYSLGPLIHNPQVVRALQEKGLGVISSLSEVRPGGAVAIVRAHGVPPEVYREAEAAGIQLVDATCPLVQKVQRLAHLLREEGYQVAILGDEDHPEVKGVRAYGGAESMILRKEEDLDCHRLGRKIGVVAQTTLPLQAFRAMTRALLERAEGDPSLREVRIFNTLCPFTLARQKEAQELAGRAEVVLVVGGRNSANTAQLVELCRQLQPHTHPVEGAEEVEARWLQGKGLVGIAAGASTPPWIIQEVQIRVQGLLNQNFFNEEVVLT